jgi:hypothetical protein
MLSCESYGISPIPSWEMHILFFERRELLSLQSITKCRSIFTKLSHFSYEEMM